jgi:hypothetical protein
VKLKKLEVWRLIKGKIINFKTKDQVERGTCIQELKLTKIRGKIEEFKNLKDNWWWNWRHSGPGTILQKAPNIEGKNRHYQGLNRKKIERNQSKLREFNKIRRTRTILKKEQNNIVLAPLFAFFFIFLAKKLVRALLCRAI